MSLSHNLQSASKRESAFLRTAHALDTRLTSAVSADVNRLTGIRHILYLTKQQQWMRSQHVWGGVSVPADPTAAPTAPTKPAKSTATTNASAAAATKTGDPTDTAIGMNDGAGIGWASDRVRLMTRIIEFVGGSRAQFWIHFPDSASCGGGPTNSIVRDQCMSVLTRLNADNRAIRIQRSLHFHLMRHKRKRNPTAYQLTPAQRSLSQANQIVTANKLAMRRSAAAKQASIIQPLESKLEALQSTTTQQLAKIESDSYRERKHFDAKWDDWNSRMTRTLLSQPIDYEQWTVLIDGKPIVSAPPAPASPPPPNATTNGSAGSPPPAAAATTTATAQAIPELSVDVIMSDYARQHLTYQNKATGAVTSEHPAMPLIRAYRLEQRTKATSVLDGRLTALTAQRDALIAASNEHSQSLISQIEQLRSQSDATASPTKPQPQS